MAQYLMQLQLLFYLPLLNLFKILNIVFIEKAFSLVLSFSTFIFYISLVYVYTEKQTREYYTYKVLLTKLALGWCKELDRQTIPYTGSKLSLNGKICLLCLKCANCEHLLSWEFEILACYYRQKMPMDWFSKTLDSLAHLGFYSR